MFLLPEDYWVIKTTQKKGRGVFAKKDIGAGTVIGDYLGKVIPTSEEDDIDESKNFYLMYYHDRASIFPDLKKSGVHLLNHSCIPNCWMYTYKGHTLYFALRHIFKGEELTVSYLVDPQDEECNPCTHLCHCGTILCTQTMHVSQERYDEWVTVDNKIAEMTKREPVKYGTYLPRLSSYPTTIKDHPVYTLFGSLEKNPEQIDLKKLPGLNAIRQLIRKTGRTLYFSHLNIHILGVFNHLIVSKSI